VVVAILACVFFQAVIFSFFKGITILGLVLRILTAYFAVKLLGEYFISYFLRVMVFFTIVSLIVFIPIFIKPDFLNTLIDLTPSFLSYQYELWGFQVDRKTMVIYNLLQEENRVRNNGPFWEPGAFGGYLVIAYIFNTIKESGLLGKVNVVYMAIFQPSPQQRTWYCLHSLFISFWKIIHGKFIIVFVLQAMLLFKQFHFGDKIRKKIGEKMLLKKRYTGCISYTGLETYRVSFFQGGFGDETR
jgi:hypothetical protein